MQILRYSLWCLNLACAVLAAQAQPFFVNLDFESATVPVIPAGQLGANVLISDGLPGWAGYIGTFPVTDILHNNLTLGGPGIALFGPQWPSSEIISDLYTATLFAGPTGTPTDSSLAQTGMVPPSARTLQVRLRGANFSVSLAGQNLSLLPIASGPNHAIFGADITPFAGQVAELRFTSHSLATRPFARLDIDNVVFSSEPIPEPSTWTLLVLGGGLLTVHCWRKSGSSLFPVAVKGS